MGLRLAMITQAVDEDDPVLGFACGWIKALAKFVDRLEVVCLREGKHDIGGNVEIMVMPKRKLRRFLYLRRYVKKALQEKRIDALLAHMCPIYAVVTGKVLKGRIPVGLWYVHSSITWRLKNAVKHSQIIYSCVEKGSLPISTEKLVITGHGIDTKKFHPSPVGNLDKIFRIISVGRITPLKRYDTLIPALKLMKKKLPSGRLRYEIYGAKTGGSDESYARNLVQAAEDAELSDVLTIKGPVLYQSVHEIYQTAHVLVNMTPHIYDKVALEACACGVPVFTTNENFRGLFGKYADILITASSEPEEMASKLERLLKMDKEERSALGGFLREQVLKYHSLDGLMRKIVTAFESMI